MSNFNKYIRTSSCNMSDCPYGDELSCVDCVRLMVAEYDAEIINKFAEELKSRLGDAIHPKDFESMKNLIDDVRKEQKKCDHYCHSCHYNYITEDEEGLYYPHCKLEENAR